MTSKDKPKVEILTLKNTLKSITSPGYTELPKDTKNQNRNNYLDSIAVIGQANVTGVNVSDVVNISGNYTDIPMSEIVEQTGNLKREITSNGGIKVPEDGTYIISIQHGWVMYPTIDSATVVAAYGTKALIPLMYELENELDTPTAYSFINSYTFYTRQASGGFTYHGKLKKGHVFYARAAHMRTGQTFPVIAAFYITKIS